MEGRQHLGFLFSLSQFLSTDESQQEAAGGPLLVIGL